MERFDLERGPVAEPINDATTPEICEQSVELAIEAELGMLSENTAALDREVAQMGGSSEVAERLRQPGWKKLKDRVIQRCLRLAPLAFIAGVYVGGQQAAEHFPRKFDDVMTTLSTPLTLLDQVLPKEQNSGPAGEHNFADDKVEAERAWLIDWLKNRSLQHGNDAVERDRMLEMLRTATVHHEVIDSMAGTLQTLNNRVTLNVDVNQEQAFAHAPLHEFSHASDKGGLRIGDQERSVITDIVKTEDAYRSAQTANNAKYAGDKGRWLPDYEFVREPSEFKARLMAVRYIFEMKPNQVADDKLIDQIYERFENGEVQDVNLRQLINVIKDRQSLKRALNELAENTAPDTEQPNRLA